MGKNQLDIQVKESGTGAGQSAVRSRVYADASRVVFDILSAKGFSGHWLLRPKQQIQWRTQESFRAIRQEGQAIFCKIKPGNNTTCFEYLLVPPLTYDAGIVYEKLAFYDNLPEPVQPNSVGLVAELVTEAMQATETAPNAAGVNGHGKHKTVTTLHIPSLQKARVNTMIPFKTVEAQVVKAPLPPLATPPAAIKSNRMSMADLPPLPNLPAPVVPAHGTAAQMLATIQELSVAAGRAEQRRIKLELIASKRSQLTDELAELQDRLKELDAEELILMEQSETDKGSAEAEEVLALLSRLVGTRTLTK